MISYNLAIHFSAKLLGSDGLTKTEARCKKSKWGHYLVFQGKATSKKRSLSQGESFSVYDNEVISKKSFHFRGSHC